MGCAVTADLNRHLSEQDNLERRSSSEQMLAQQWFSHPEKIQAAWDRVISDRNSKKEFLKLASERSMRSGRFFGMDETIGNTLFLRAVDDLVEEAMLDMASEHIDMRIRDAEMDAAADAADDRDWEDRYG